LLVGRFNFTTGTPVKQIIIFVVFFVFFLLKIFDTDAISITNELIEINQLK
jgi:hypothetical protein